MFNPRTREAEAGSVEASLVYQRELQERQGYLEKPCFGGGESAVLLALQILFQPGSSKMLRKLTVCKCKSSVGHNHLYENSLKYFQTKVGFQSKQ